jgi:predicted nucleic acid-binding protein
MIVVSDTSPIRYLIAIGQIDILFDIFGHIIVPQAVYEELQHPNTPVPVAQWVSSAPVWFEVRTPATVTPIKGLGHGELQAIALAQEIEADVLLTDDGRARKAAFQKGLQVVGTLRILYEASRRGLLEFSQAIAALRATNFYVQEEVVYDLLNRNPDS